MDLISVIVPVYKVEAYLDRCVQSIVNQTYQNLEIILVDDGSPDNCGAMCDAWAEKDSRIRVIHKANGGLSDARNAGMEIATGEFIAFVDSDDYIAVNMYEMLLNRLQEDQSDVAVCNATLVFEDGSASCSIAQLMNCILSREIAMKSIIEERLLKYPVWLRLYRRNLIQNLPFLVGKLHEDVFWSYQAIGAANKISIVDSPLYYYTQRQESIMGASYNIRRLDGLEAKAELLKYVQLNFPKLENTAKVQLLFSCMYHYQQCLLHLDGTTRKNAIKCIRNILNQGKTYPLFCQISFKQQIWYTMAQINLNAVCRLRNALKIGC